MTLHSGDLYIKGNMTLHDLTAVEGELYLLEGATLTAPSLVTIGRHLLTAPLLTTAGGYLLHRSKAVLIAPELSTVGGHLTLHESPTVNIPKLTTIGKGLILGHGVTLNAPNLRIVGEELRILPDAELKAPLTSAYGQPGHELARSPERGYVLWLGDNGRYYAGCRQQGFTRKQALKHWSSDTPRAKLFRAAILNNPERKTS